MTVLTAVGTVVAGLLAFFKSRGQPNRVRQLRSDLRRACDKMREAEADFKNPKCTRTLAEAVEDVRKCDERARENAQTNYPDTWSAPPVKP